ncbi:FAD-dependent oxidoreductase [Leucobacter weissii]|uniref:FAD-dependent oxidoreductase n=1 Tax=Leucobacter weissii TaxID=1983706 RepID=A0A939MTH1_9MICO|nr:NAD(P)/FAD-dependent oxidoreductase [Leucobacter weissii]MBO1902689.1 FAD-dependent oxidoreductase [Leucobacter weissii]
MGLRRNGRVVIVGGGPAAAAAAVALRGHGHEGTIEMLCAESTAPYSRPPLSKTLLRGEVDASDLALDVADAEVHTSARAVRVDFDARSVELAHGERRPYDGLVIATGTAARRPSDPTIEVLQTIEDAVRIAPRLRAARSVLVVGSGFLAHELASAARTQGAETSLVVRPRALARRIGPMLAELIEARAAQAGVRLVESAGGDFRDGGFTTAAGERLDADLVLAAIGSKARSFDTTGAPASRSEAYVVDQHCRLRDGVVVAGDAAVVRTPDGRLRSDRSWMSALAQGAAAARGLLDDDAPVPATVSYAWTEAYGLEVKISGTPPIGESPVVLDGDLSDGRALLQWPGGAAAAGYRIPTPRLRALASATSATPGS